MLSGSEADRGAVASAAVPSADPSDLKGGCDLRREEADVEAAGGGVEKQGDCVGELERLCRICHLGSSTGGPAGSELIHLGCLCKGELGSAHRPCAEAWFRIKGNRCCEICAVCAKNINAEEDNSFMETWHGGRLGRGRTRDSSNRNNCWRNQPFCNFLIFCLIIAFVLPWFFHINIF